MQFYTCRLQNFGNAMELCLWASTHRQGAQRASHSCIWNLGPQEHCWQVLYGKDWELQDCHVLQTLQSTPDGICPVAELSKRICLRIKIWKPKIARSAVAENDCPPRASIQTHSSKSLPVTGAEAGVFSPQCGTDAGMSDSCGVKAVVSASLASIPEGKIELHGTHNPHTLHDSVLIGLSN